MTTQSIVMPMAGSKKYKLPKKFWIKGKSKFLYPRLIEEGIPFGNTLWNGHMSITPIDELYTKCGFGERTEHLPAVIIAENRLKKLYQEVEKGKQERAFISKLLKK